MQSKAKTVKAYLAELPKERREAVSAIRETILKNLPAGYEEGMQYGMIGYFVPHSVYPPGYHCDPSQPLPFAALASQKHHISISLMCIYSDDEQRAWFQQAWAKTGKKLDMGKSCIRCRKLEDVPLKVIGQAIKRVPAKKFIAYYEAGNSKAKGRRLKAEGKQPAAKTTVRKRAAKKAESRQKAEG